MSVEDTIEIDRVQLIGSKPLKTSGALLGSTDNAGLVSRSEKMTFERQFHRRDYDLFLDNFELAIEQGTRIRLADEAMVQNWRPDMADLLVTTLEDQKDYFVEAFVVCKMIILESVAADYDGLWFYTVGRRENAAYVWRPEGWS